MLIEVTTFRSADGVSDDAFLAADYRVQTEVVPNLAGFARRTTARSADGEWAVIALWGSQEEADAAEQAVYDHPATRELLSLIDEATISIRRYATLD